MTPIERLVDLMARLRGPGGCPWDLEQTHQSLKPYLVEETYEVMDAIDDGDDVELSEELGDVLLQVVFHARIAEEEERFTIDDVADAISGKLIRRHPHVFGDLSVEDSNEVLENWNAIKSEEKREKGIAPSTTALDGVPRSMPALLRSRKIQEKAARTGFEWADQEEIADKIREEVDELSSAARSGDLERTEEELGDLLFATAAMGRYMGICPEEALRKATEKFRMRFGKMESLAKTTGRPFSESTIEEMDSLWKRAKECGE